MGECRRYDDVEDGPGACLIRQDSSAARVKPVGVSGLVLAAQCA